MNNHDKVITGKAHNPSSANRGNDETTDVSLIMTILKQINSNMAPDNSSITVISSVYPDLSEEEKGMKHCSCRLNRRNSAEETTLQWSLSSGDEHAGKIPVQGEVEPDRYHQSLEESISSSNEKSTMENVATSVSQDIISEGTNTHSTTEIDQSDEV